MTEQLNVQQMAEKLLTADDILILCHKNPDGDTVGCGSALYYALSALDKTAAVLCSDPCRIVDTTRSGLKERICSASGVIPCGSVSAT